MTVEQRQRIKAGIVLITLVLALGAGCVTGRSRSLRSVQVWCGPGATCQLSIGEEVAR